MRKKLGIVITVFIYPAEEINGQSCPTCPIVEGLIEGLMKLLILTPAIITEPLSDDKKKYPKKTFSCSLPWHPGDYYYEKNYKIIKPINLKLQNCKNKCLKKNKNQNVGKGYYENKCYKNFWGNYTPCFGEAMKTFPHDSISYCKKVGTDGAYSDDSYYSTSIGTSHNLLTQVFRNTHELKDAYEKNEWQKARDKCMEIASKTKRKSFDNSDEIFKKTYFAYNDCLTEKGF